MHRVMPLGSNTKASTWVHNSEMGHIYDLLCITLLNGKEELLGVQMAMLKVQLLLLLAWCNSWIIAIRQPLLHTELHLKQSIFILIQKEASIGVLELLSCKIRNKDGSCVEIRNCATGWSSTGRVLLRWRDGHLRPAGSISGDCEWHYMGSVTKSYSADVGILGKTFTSGTYSWWLSGGGSQDLWQLGDFIDGRIREARAHGIATVACIPLSGGVVELGSTDGIEEDRGLVLLAKSVFSSDGPFSGENHWGSLRTHEDVLDHPQIITGARAWSPPHGFKGKQKEEEAAATGQGTSSVSGKISYSYGKMRSTNTWTTTANRRKEMERTSSSSREKNRRRCRPAM